MTDNLADAQLVLFPGNAGEQDVTGDNTACTIEAGEPYASDYRSDWWIVQAYGVCDVTVAADVPSGYACRLSAFADTGGNLAFADLAESTIDVDATTIMFRQNGNITTCVRLAGLDDTGTPYGLSFTAEPSQWTPTGQIGTFTNPLLVAIPADGGTYTSPSITNTDYPQSPNGPGDSWSFPVWWLYIPASDGFLAMNTGTSGGNPSGVETEISQGVSVFTDTQGSITFLDQATGPSLGVAVTAGTPYWIRLATADPGDVIQYVLQATGPASASYGTGVTATPVDTFTELPLPTFGTQTLDAAPIEGYTDVGGAPVKVIAAPPVDSFISPRAPVFASIRRVLGRPSADATVPVDVPQLTVSVQPIEGDYDTVTVEVQYALTGQLTGGSPTLTTTVDGGINISIATVVTPALADGTYQWRARLVTGGVTGAWTPARAFTVDTTASDVTAPVTWTVTTASPAPHLWSATPAGGVPGDLVTIRGQGLPVAAPTVTIAGHPATVLTARHVAATSLATTAARTLAEVEHDEITFVVPAVEAPGGPLVVQGSS